MGHVQGGAYSCVDLARVSWASSERAVCSEKKLETILAARSSSRGALLSCDLCAEVGVVFFRPGASVMVS